MYTAAMATALYIFLAVIGLGVLIAGHELGHYLLARLTGMRVLRFSIGFGPALLSKTHNGIEYVISVIPFGGYVLVPGLNPEQAGDTEGEEKSPRWAKALTIAAGPVFSYVLGIVMYFAFFFVGQTGLETVFHVAEVVEGSAAEKGGLKAGDDIGMMDNFRPGTLDGFGKYIDDNMGNTVVFKLDRGGELMALSVDLPAEKTDKGVLGIRYSKKVNEIHSEVGFTEAIVKGAKQSVMTSVMILGALGQIFTKPKEVEIGGPPAIVNELKKSAERGPLKFLWMLAGLTVMFGLLNVLPVPALDGSKLMLLGIEAVVRRDIPAKFQLVFHLVGLVLLFGLMIIVSIADVVKMATKALAG